MENTSTEEKVNKQVARIYQEKHTNKKLVQAKKCDQKTKICESLENSFLFLFFFLSIVDNSFLFLFFLSFYC